MEVERPTVHARVVVILGRNCSAIEGTSADQALSYVFFCGALVLALAHLARAAFLALALLSSGLSMAARLFPPFEPPIFPNATA
jgi:hypothetical protein